MEASLPPVLCIKQPSLYKHPVPWLKSLRSCYSNPIEKKQPCCPAYELVLNKGSPGNLQEKLHPDVCLIMRWMWGNKLGKMPDSPNKCLSGACFRLSSLLPNHASLCFMEHMRVVSKYRAANQPPQTFTLLCITFPLNLRKHYSVWKGVQQTAVLLLKWLN